MTAKPLDIKTRVFQPLVKGRNNPTKKKFIFRTSVAQKRLSLSSLFKKPYSLSRRPTADQQA